MVGKQTKLKLGKQKGQGCRAIDQQWPGMYSERQQRCVMLLSKTYLLLSTDSRGEQKRKIINDVVSNQNLIYPIQNKEDTLPKGRLSTYVEHEKATKKPLLVCAKLFQNNRLYVYDAITVDHL